MKSESALLTFQLPTRHHDATKMIPALSRSKGRNTSVKRRRNWVGKSPLLLPRRLVVRSLSGAAPANQSLQTDRGRITVFRSSEVSRRPRLLSELFGERRE